MLIEEISVKELLDECVGIKQLLAARYGINLEVDIDDANASITGYRELLRAALNNLIDTSIKHHRGSGRITIAFHQDAARVSIVVSNNCAGIPYEELCDIQDLFCRSGKSFEDEPESMNPNLIGLSIVRDVADMHGGRVGVRSPEGSGSTFSMHLPQRCRVA